MSLLHRFALPLLLLLALTVTACAGGPQPTPPTEPAPPADTILREPGIYEVATGERLTEQELIDRLAGARFVLVGESHDDPWHHAAQARIYDALVAHHDGAVALGMEMFERPAQPHLDAYVAGDIDEAELLERTNWEQRWGFDADLYRSLWRTAREHDAPVVALNARRELVRRVGKVGVEGLTDEERAELPELDLDDPDYRRFMADILAMHAHGGEVTEERADRFFQAQVVWDETMAATAVDAMAAHPDLEAMVLIAGRGHIERDFGIPPRIRRRLDDGDAAVVTIVPITLSKAAHSPHGQRYLSLAFLQDAHIADFVWIGPPDAQP